MLQRVVCSEGGKGGCCVGWKEVRFEPPLLIADALLSLWTLEEQCC